MRTSTDADYSASSRILAGKIEIYLDGTSSAPPVVVTKDDYLIDFEVLNDLGVSNTSPEQTLTANVLNFSMYNRDHMFSPQNTSGPYYGKLIKGVKVVPYIHVGDETVEWDALGTFYVSDWSVQDDAITANIEAYDKAYTFINDSNTARIPIKKDDVPGFYGLLIPDITISLLGGAASATIPYLFTISDRYTTFNKINNALGYFANVNRAETLSIGPLPFRTNSVVINDNMQLISAKIPPTFIKQYDDVTLSYFLPTVQSNQTLLDMSDIDLVKGDNTYEHVAFTKNYVLSVDNCYVEAASYVSLVSMVANSTDMTLILNNRDAAVKGTVQVFGQALNLAKLELTGNDKCLAISNEFLQTEVTAKARRNKLIPYVNCTLPMIELDLRGNPHILVGDRITVTSIYYKLTFTGIVTSATYKYEGGFSSHVVVMNTAAIGG